MTPRPPLLDTAEARGAVEVWAMPARRMGWVVERRVVKGVVRVGVGEDIGGMDRGGYCICGVEGGRELGLERARFCLLLVNELESSIVCCCSESTKGSI